MTYAHADSLIISALAGVGQLTLYSLPFTLTNRVLSITMRITQVVMPAVSALQARGEIERMRSPYLAYSRYAFYLNSFFGLLLGLFGAQILEVWLGAQYAETGGVVVLLIAAGMVVDSLTNMPSQVNDGLGRPKITGLFALARAVLGIGLGYFLTRSFGIVGAASAHLIASAIMTIAFLAYVHRGVFPGTSGEVLRHAYASVLVVAVLSVLMTFGVRSVHGASLAWTVVDAGLFATVYAVLGYMIVLAASDRNQIRMLVRSFFARPVPPT